MLRHCLELASLIETWKSIANLSLGTTKTLWCNQYFSLLRSSIENLRRFPEFRLASRSCSRPATAVVASETGDFREHEPSSQSFSQDAIAESSRVKQLQDDEVSPKLPKTLELRIRFRTHGNNLHCYNTILQRTAHALEVQRRPIPHRNARSPVVRPTHFPKQHPCLSSHKAQQAT